MEVIKYIRNNHCLSVILLALVLIGCKVPLSNFHSGPIGIPALSNRFILAWDYPEDQIDSLPSNIIYFNVYYRTLSDDSWSFLSSTEGSMTELYTQIFSFSGAGEYIIGVEGVRANGESTEMITSIDFDSYPAGGWYLVISN